MPFRAQEACRFLYVPVRSYSINHLRRLTSLSPAHMYSKTLTGWGDATRSNEQAWLTFAGIFLLNKLEAHYAQLAGVAKKAGKAKELNLNRKRLHVQSRGRRSGEVQTKTLP